MHKKKKQYTSLIYRNAYILHSKIHTNVQICIDFSFGVLSFWFHAYPLKYKLVSVWFW